MELTNHLHCEKVLSLEILSGGKVPNKLALEVTDMQNPSFPSLYGNCCRQNCVHAIKLWFIFILAHILDIMIWELYFSLFSGTTWLEPEISGNSKTITTPPNMQGWGGKIPSCLQNQLHDTSSSSYLSIFFLFTLSPPPLASHCCSSLLSDHQHEGEPRPYCRHASHQPWLLPGSWPDVAGGLISSPVSIPISCCSQQECLDGPRFDWCLTLPGAADGPHYQPPALPMVVTAPQDCACWWGHTTHGGCSWLIPSLRSSWCHDNHLKHQELILVVLCF